MTDPHANPLPPQESPPVRSPARPDARRGRPVGDRDAKRRELLAAGIAVISEEGYVGASLRKVARKAGYTTGAVTYYFENKEALVAAIIEHLFDEWDTLLDSGDDRIDVRERYRRWLALSADSQVWSAQFQLLAQARHEPAFADIYRQRYERYRDGVTAVLSRQQAAGLIRADISADILSDLVGAIGDGWMMMLPIEPARFAPRRIEVLLAAVVTLLAPR